MTTTETKRNGALVQPSAANDETLVYLFHWRDDSRPMRVVITVDNDVSFEEPDGFDALGVERWSPVDFDEEDSSGHPEMIAWEWAQVAALAVARGERVRPAT
jgi:hypothetical protein